ncbi:MAG: hypothetical protein AAF802_26660, partial [Planctomycetota bacterium]
MNIRWLLLLLYIATYACCNVFAQSSDLMLLTRFDDRLRGHVVSVTSRELIFQSDGFLDEFAIPLDDVVEVKSLDARTTRNQSDVYAFADGSVVIQAKGDGETPRPASLKLDEATRSKAVAKMTLPEVPRMVHSVAYSAHRLRLQSGWQYSERGDLSASSQPSMRDGTMAVFNG